MIVLITVALCVLQNVIDLTESAAFQALLQAATVLTDDQRRKQVNSPCVTLLIQAP